MSRTVLADAHAAVEAITKTESEDFYYGIRLLPADKRAVLYAVHALARRVDDTAGGDLPVDEKVRGLAALRSQLTDIDTSTDPVLVALADAARRYPLPLGAFCELIDGVEMDVARRRYETFDELVTYCRCVAGAVGRLCLGVFGSKPHPQAVTYADQLGIALQQTNILRNLREDLLDGRVYLPQEELERFGVDLKLDENGALADPNGRLSVLIRFSSLRARRWYRNGLRLTPLLDWRSRAACLAMASIYGRLQNRIETQPRLVLTGRLSLSSDEKTGAALRYLTGLGS